MDKIGLFFGTETGTTRLVAKKMHKKIGDALCDKPLNVNRITPAEMLRYPALILGTPSYGIEEIPAMGVSGCFEPNWGEFLAQMPADVFECQVHGVLRPDRISGAGPRAPTGWHAPRWRCRPRSRPRQASPSHAPAGRRLRWR